MPRPAKVDSGKSLTIHARTPSEEERIRAFKEIHARNPDLRINDTIMECINHFLAKHNYPPGNSQTLLQVFFDEEPKLVCWRCKGKFKTLRKVQFVSNLIANICNKCYTHYNKKGLIKRHLAK